jgi:hypothetical protein
MTKPLNLRTTRVSVTPLLRQRSKLDEDLQTLSRRVPGHVLFVLRRDRGHSVQHPGGRRGRAVKIGGFGIGLTVALDILAGGAVTGASMNPARSFGPALEMVHWEWHWAYWVAPTAGACAAALVYDHVLLKPMKPSVNEPRAMRA